MGEFLKRCESVRIKCRATEEDMRLSFSKKRKVYSKLENDSCGEAELAENSVSPAASRTSSCSKHEDSSDVVKMSPSSPDLEVRIRNSNATVGFGATLWNCVRCVSVFGPAITAIVSFIE